MVGLITSTLFPANKGIFGEVRSVFTSKERIEQTQHTIDSLRKNGVHQIFLADNSGQEFQSQILQLFPNVISVSFDAYQFNNKSINEALLILNTLKYLPSDNEILKISGRYYLNEGFTKPSKMEEDFIVSGLVFNTGRGMITTKCYLVKNKEIYEQFMLQVLIELFSYPFRLVGPRNFLTLLNQFFKPSFNESTISLEFASARVLKYSNFAIQVVPQIGVEGYLATLHAKRIVKE